jgi:hypothetical protein
MSPTEATPRRPSLGVTSARRPIVRGDDDRPARVGPASDTWFPYYAAAAQRAAERQTHDYLRTHAAARTVLLKQNMLTDFNAHIRRTAMRTFSAGQAGSSYTSCSER